MSHLNIKSLLDTDLYKFTMMQVVYHQLSNVTTEYSFKCRNNKRLSPYVSEIREQIEQYCNTRFTEHELEYLRSLSFFQDDFIAFLKGYQPSMDYVRIGVDGEDIKIDIKGPWVQTILFEVPVLSIVNEIYFKHNKQKLSDGVSILRDKIDYLYDEDSRGELNFKLADFGTRRRYSRDWQDVVVNELKEKIPNILVGTSNVHLARKYNLKPIGTMAHEYLQAFQALTHPSLSQKAALQMWVDEYRGQLGIALTDVIGMDSFLKDFDLSFANSFDGCRHDSGDPYEWCVSLIEHYKKLGINPMTKSAVFSDGLNSELAIDLAKTFKGRIKTSFGIGTNITNDFGENHEPLQIVMKMVRCNELPVAKISDNISKAVCVSKTHLEYLKECFNL